MRNGAYNLEMSIPLTIEKQLENYAKREGHMDRHETMWHAWCQNKRWLEQLLQITLHSFPTYSRHDVTHALAVLNNIEMILGQDRIAELSATDCFVLLHTVYIHDIGMCITQQDRKDIIENEEFIDMIDELQISGDDTTRKAIEVLKQTDYDWDNKEDYIVRMKQLYRAKLEVYYAIIQLMSDYRRFEHGKKSAERLYNWTMESDKLGSGFSMAGVPLRIFLSIARCAQMHTYETFDDIKKLPCEDGGYASDHYHPRFIAVLLMLGDLLDMDNDRFHPMVFEFVEEFPETSRNHFDKHRAIRKLNITSNIIEIEADCENQNALRLVRKECEMLTEVLRNAGYMWSTICPPGFQGSLPTLGEVNLFLNGKQIPEELVTAQFHISQKKAFSILEGANLYEGRFVFLREFLQNAIDASKMQYWNDYMGMAAYYYDQDIDEKSPDQMNDILPLDKYPVEIGMKMQKKNGKGERSDITEDECEQIKAGKLRGYEYGVLVTVKDFGTGIDKESIEAISKVGNSRSKERRIIEKMPKWLRPTAEFGVGLQSAFLLTGSFKCYTHTRSGEQYEITFSSGASSRYEGYINVVPQNYISGKQMSFGTCFEVFVPLKKKLLHSESIPTWSGADPFGKEYDNLRPFRHAAEMISQMAVYLDGMLGEVLFPIILKIDKKSVLPLALNTQKDNTIYKMTYSLSIKERGAWKKSWIYQKEEKQEDYYFGATDNMSFALNYDSAKLYIWNQEIHTFCVASGISILKREEEYRRNRNHDIKKVGTTVYYKGIELKKNYILDGIEMFEYIDIKGELERSYININRRGFTLHGERYFEEHIYRGLVDTVKNVLKYINTCKERKKIKENLIERIQTKINLLSAKKTVGEEYNNILKKLAEQIVTVSLLGYWAVNDVNDEISRLGSNCGTSEECIWQDIITEITKKLENYRIVRSELREVSMIFDIEGYELADQSGRVTVLTILDIFKRTRHYAILQVRENQYAKWICYVINVDSKIYKEVENIIFNAPKQKASIKKVEEWQKAVFEFYPSIGDPLPADHKYEQQFFLTWLAKNVPTMAVISDREGNARINILSNYIYPCIYVNQNHKLLIIERILKTACEEKINRFSIYAWHDRQFLAVKKVPFSCYFVNRGYLNPTSLHKVIFPLDGKRLRDIMDVLERADKYEFIQNVKILAERLDYKAYLTELLRAYNAKELDEDSEAAKLAQRMKNLSSKKGQNLTSIIQDALEFFLDFLTSDMSKNNSVVCDSEYFARMKISEDKWHKCYIGLASLLLELKESEKEDETETGNKLKTFENDEIIKDIYAGYHFLQSEVQVEFEKPQYSKIAEFKERYLRECEQDVELMARNERIQNYISENSRYPIRWENMTRCYEAFIEEIFKLLKTIESRKLHAVLVNILKNN